MDLLHQRYASPFPFIDSMIQANKFGEFVDSFIRKIHKEKNEKLTWEFYIHRIYDKSFNEFNEELENDARNQNMSEQEVETTIQQTIDMVNEFNERHKGGEG